MQMIQFFTSQRNNYKCQQAQMEDVQRAASWFRVYKLSLESRINTEWFILVFNPFRFSFPIITPQLPFEPSGELTLEEFIEGAKDHDDIMDMLKKMMDLTPVFIIIVEGRAEG